MRNLALKTPRFRFVDVLPALSIESPSGQSHRLESTDIDWDLYFRDLQTEGFFTTDVTAEYRIPNPTPLPLSGFYLGDLEWNYCLIDGQIQLVFFQTRAQSSRIYSPPAPD